MSYVRWFSEISLDDVASVGGKNASLGEMYRELAPFGIPVTNGFAITADAYRDVLTTAGAWARLHQALDGLDAANVADLASRAQRAHDLVLNAPLPETLLHEIRDGYRKLEQEYGPRTAVAVRSSATAEDLPNASFAGQHESFLNITGEEMLIDAYRRCIASLFLERAVHYRIDQGFDHFKVALSVGVMKMVRSDKASSGVAFTLDTESGFRDVVMITGSYGLGENIVQGAVDPDEFYVHKPTYESGYRAVLSRRLGSKAKRLVFADGTDTLSRTINEPTPVDAQQRFCLDDDEVLTLAGYCLAVERHYGKRAGERSGRLPMDVEWAKDGEDGRIYLVQCRPETVASQHSNREFQLYHLEINGASPILRGRAVGTKVAHGPVRVVRDASELPKVMPGDVIVARTTTPDWEPVMRIASAIVTDSGGRTCHAAIVARELGIPAVVGTECGTTSLRDGMVVTVSCAQGEDGLVFDGAVPFHSEQIDTRKLGKPPVAIMTILGDRQVRSNVRSCRSQA